jgi:hypothetical protein
MASYIRKETSLSKEIRDAVDPP